MDTQVLSLPLWLWIAAPWVLAGPLAALRFRPPRRLPPRADRAPVPYVSIVVPARNEATNIARCLQSLLRQDYDGFEVIVLNDRSDDDTSDVARATVEAVDDCHADTVSIVDGDPLPDGWFGKPWACHQAAALARGEILLFTDADTVHQPDLLRRTVGAMQDVGADALSLVGRQIMGSFWEGVIQPQVFVLLASRYPNSRKLFDPYMQGPGPWKHAIANGQYILISRASYESVGGHESVRSEVVEDLRLGQELVRAGGRLAMREAPRAFATRMYRSLGGLVEGWSKNFWTASRQAYDGRLGSLLFAAAVVGLLALWVAPPVTLAFSAVLGGPSALTAWAATATGASLVFWTAATWRIGGSPLYALGYPFGAAATAAILVRSWRRGDTVEWKGRVYDRGDGLSVSPSGAASVRDEIQP